MTVSRWNKFISNRTASIIFGAISGILYGFYVLIIFIEPSLYESYERFGLSVSFAIFIGFSILFIIGVVKKDIKFLIPHICIEFTIVIMNFGFFIGTIFDSLYANSNLGLGLSFGLVFIFYVLFTWIKVLYFLQLFKGQYITSDPMMINKNQTPSAIAPVLTEKHNVV